MCPLDSPELKRHLAFRDFLRANIEAVAEYSILKTDLAARYDLPEYTERKTDFVHNVLKKAGLKPLA